MKLSLYPNATDLASGTVIGVQSGATVQFPLSLFLSASSAVSTFAPLASPTFTGTVSGITAAMVGLGNADNTSDVNKPVSTAQQTALNLKAPIASPTFTGTVSGITAAMVGLGNVNNTSDASKPISTATQTALDLKAPIASPTFTGTVGGITAAMVGLGNVTNTSDANKPVSTAQQTALNLKANLASPTFTGTVSGITAAMVGLGSVDNTSDASKPVSTAQQTALNLKANIASPTFTGTVAGITAAMVGLGNVNNTSDASKPVSTATQTALDLKAPLASPSFTGTITSAGSIGTTAGDVSAGGDLRSVRPGSPTTGVLYLGNTGGRYLYYDGTNYQMPGAGLTLNGSTVWTAGNLTNLSQLTNGPGYTVPSGSYTWAAAQTFSTKISTFLNISPLMVQSSTDANWKANFTNTPAQGWSYGGEQSGGGPQGTWWFNANIRHSNGSNYWGMQQAWGWEDNANELWTRNVSGGSWGSWVRFLNSSNYGAYANFGGTTLTCGALNPSGTVNAGGNAFYGGIYYDGNNAGYYCDPASTTNLNTTNLQGVLTVNNTAYMQFIYDVQNTGYYCDPNATSRLSTVLADAITSYGTMYATVYYDQNNSGYYCDPNGRSRLSSYNLDVGVWNISSDGYNRVLYNNGDATQYSGGTSGTYNHSFCYNGSGVISLMYATNFYTQGDIIAYWSDGRLKKNLERITDWRKIIDNLTGYRFEWNEYGRIVYEGSVEGKREVGLIAQDVEAVYPEAVAIQELQYKSQGVPKDGINYDPNDPYKTILYDKLMPVVIEALKQAHLRIDQLEKEINNGR
jgi:hypothetical protein